MDLVILSTLLVQDHRAQLSISTHYQQRVPARSNVTVSNLLSLAGVAGDCKHHLHQPLATLLPAHAGHV